MMSKALLVGFAGLLLLVPHSKRGIAENSAATCSMIVPLLPEAPETIGLLVVATADSVRYPLSQPAGLSDKSPVWPDSGSVFGQAFDVIKTTSGTAPTAPVITIVPWGYDPSCRLIPWLESATWVTPGDTAFFLAPSVQQWTDPGERLDIFGWHMPYPHVNRGFYSPPRTEADGWLTAPQVFELADYIVVGRDAPTPDPIGDAIRSWAADNPTLTGAQPVFSLLEMHRRSGAS